LTISDDDLRSVHAAFARGAAAISCDSFLQALRGVLNPRRQLLVQQAFNRLDKNGNGAVDATEVAGAYDASRHPDVLAGKKTQNEVYREFLDCFDCGGEVDGSVTLAEFINYYSNVSASIDDDDYFELCIRNAWHMGADNTASRRMLVTDGQGNERVVALENDLGLKSTDTAGFLARLKSSGVDATNVSFAWGSEDKQAVSRPPPPPLGSRKKLNPTFQSTFSLG
jgi:calcyphosin